MNYETFKNEMKNYKAYMDSVAIIKGEINVIIYEMSGVKAIRYDKQPMGYNPAIAAEIRDSLSKKLAEKEKELDFTLLAVEHIESKLNKLPKETQDMCILLFVQGCTCHAVGALYGYTDSGLWRKVKREVERI